MVKSRPGKNQSQRSDLPSHIIKAVTERVVSQLTLKKLDHGISPLKET